VAYQEGLRAVQIVCLLVNESVQGSVDNDPLIGQIGSGDNWRFAVPNPPGTLVILPEILHGFTQSCLGKSEIVPQTGPQPYVTIFLLVHHSPSILLFWVIARPAENIVS
jgi:hypothetical protein